MAVRIGPFDPLGLIFNIMNALLDAGTINVTQAKQILKNSLDPALSDADKNKIVESLLKQK